MNDIAKEYKISGFDINDMILIKKLFKEIFALSLKINFETNAGVSINSSAHVDLFEIRIYKNKKHYEIPDFKFDFYCYYFKASIIEELKKAKKAIQKVYKESLNVKRTNI